MTFREVLTVAGVFATILEAFLTIYALINKRTLKEESRLTRETIKETNKETHEETLKVLKYIADLIAMTMGSDLMRLCEPKRKWGQSQATVIRYFRFSYIIPKKVILFQRHT